MSKFTVLFDACVLVPMHLRNLLMWMAQSGLFRAKWSNEIHKEWIRNVIRIRGEKGLTRAQLKELERVLKKTRSDMDNAVLDALVEGYEDLTPNLTEINSKDRHVLAAAIVGKVQTIVTYNLKDFPKKALSKFDIESVHPDAFLSDQADLDFDRCLELTRQARIHLKSPPLDPDRYLEALGKLKLDEFVKLLERDKDRI